MKIFERFKTLHGTLADPSNQSLVNRLLVTVLFCMLLLVIVIVNVVNSRVYDVSDYFEILSSIRLLILTGVGFVGGLFIVLAINKAKLEWHFLVLSLGVGLMYMFTMTPLSVSDEHVHYLTSAFLSGNMIDWGSTTFSRYSDFDISRLALHVNTPIAYLRLFEEGIRTIDSYPYPYLDIHLPYIMKYFPQAVGISLGRFLGLNFLGLFYLGRFFNLLYFVLCGFFAIRAVKEFKLPLLIIGILPMSLHQAASFNPDAFINGTAILFIAYLIRCLYERDEWSLRDIIVMAAVGVLLAPAKTVYFAIVLLILFAAPHKFGWKNAKGYVVAGVICAIGIANILFFNLVDLQSTAASADVERWHGGRNFTPAFIFENPWETVLIFLRTLWHYHMFYLLSMFGHQLAGLTLILPRWFIYVFMVLLAASLFYGRRDSWIPAWSHRVAFFLACAAVVGLSLLGMFLAWTPDTHPVILGIQGRYFIPILPLAVLMFRSRLLFDKRNFAFAIIGVAVVMHFLVILFILDYTISLL